MNRPAAERRRHGRSLAVSSLLLLLFAAAAAWVYLRRPAYFVGDQGQGCQARLMVEGEDRYYLKAAGSVQETSERPVLVPCRGPLSVSSSKAAAPMVVTEAQRVEAAKRDVVLPIKFR